MSNSQLFPAPESLVGQVVADRYRVLAELGRGAYGVVYAVEHRPSQRRLALKILTPESGSDGAELVELAARFRREAQAASLLDHPHIIEVLDLGTLADGMLFLVMELVDGTPLDTLVEARAIGPRRALVLCRQVLEALSYAHERGVVHRDLKPENVMLVRAGQPGQHYDVVKLVDFGLVKLIGDLAGELGAEKLTRTGFVYGTPTYIAPEQALGRVVDGRADLYSVGVMLFEMLVGHPPFVSDDPMEVVRMHVLAAPPSLASVAPGAPWCTAQMELLVGAALEKTPEQRFASAQEMIAILDDAFVSISHLPAER